MKSYNPQAKVHINYKEQQERTWWGCVSGKFVKHLDSATGFLLECVELLGISEISDCSIQPLPFF